MKLNGGSGRQQKTNAARAPACKCPSHCSAPSVPSLSTGAWLLEPGNSMSTSGYMLGKQQNAKWGLLLFLPSDPHMWSHPYRVPPSVHPSLPSATCGTMSRESPR